MERVKKYAVMYVPRSGLFYAGGDFLDGRMNRIPWKRTIPIYRSHSAAEVARNKFRERWPNVEGEFIVLSVELIEKDGPEPDILDVD